MFRAKYSEMEWVVNKNNGGGSGGGGGGMGGGGGGGGGDDYGGESSDAVVRLRGLPYECSKDDIRKFFDGKDSTREPTRYSSFSIEKKSCGSSLAGQNCMTRGSSQVHHTLHLPTAQPRIKHFAWAGAGGRFFPQFNQFSAMHPCQPSLR